MKFLRFLCNFLLFIALCLSISLVQIGIYDISAAAQSEDIDGIHIVAPHDNAVSYLDEFTFWGTDIKVGLKNEPKYRVRNWVANDWWKKGTKWIDYTIEFCVSVVKPIVFPVSESNALMNYYGYDINHFNEYFKKYVFSTDEELNNALYEMYVIFGKGYGEAYAVGFESPVKIQDYEYTGTYKGAENLTEYDYARWVTTHRKLYNTVYRLERYNSDEFGKYFTKFITEDENGNRHIKSAAVVLYYQQYVAIILALVFVIKFPISFLQGRYVSSGKGKKNKLAQSKRKDIDVSF